MHNPSPFAIGQRWLSDTEPELGLGIVSEQDHRTVTVSFRSCDQIRRYAKDQAPLNRIAFASGDTINTCTGEQFVVIEVITVNDTLIYHSHAIDDKKDEIKLPESLLSDTLVLSKPTERLFTGQIDNASWFFLRQQTIEHLSLIERSEILGLCSARTDLIPHQLYIASEVAKRYAPRVMLADEVGLGKTIEAGLILQQQLANGLASRVLIIVPEPLLHQWLVEMLRRFNLQFSLFSEERCQETMQAMIENEELDHNPLMDEQLVLTSVELFQKQPEWFDFALKGEWDLCIVDEAHHLRDDSEDHAEGTESEKHNDYTRIKRIADASKGVLLLTATPEQMGRKNHFALLQLLDPNRFTNYAEYEDEHSRYGELADTINALIDGKPLSDEQQDRLQQILAGRHSAESIAEMFAPLAKNTKANASQKRQAQDQLVRMLLDQHGTGRILFRNTRKSLSGFPERALNVIELEQPEEYLALQAATPDSLDVHIKPESAYISALAERDDEEVDSAPQWTAFDARVKWLIDFLKKNKDEKVLLICAQDITAINLERYLRVNEGVRGSVFHRHMNIIDRDRAAAYFAGNEQSAQILVCSEIGSEGRNFQFCRHLVLFDLPMNPDLLEQRIGRLDRIGQKNTIQLHVPVFANSAQSRLLRWYQEALNAFEHVAPAAYRVYRHFEKELTQAILDPRSNSADFDAFIAKASALNAELNLELENGRDRLLEVNSFNSEIAQDAIAKINAFESTNTPEQYLKDSFDVFGIHHEQNSDGSYILKASEDMIVSEFPALPDEGMTVTFDRALSLHREDIQFLTWQHPMVRGLMDIVLDSPQGGAALSIFADVQDPILKGHEVIVETIYRIVAPAPRQLQLPKFLEHNHFHFAMLKEKVDERVDPQQLKASLQALKPKLKNIDRNNAATLVTEYHNDISELLARSQKLAEHQMKKSVETAATQMLQIQTAEIKRLVALKKVNPNVRESELKFLKEQTLQLHQCLKQASVELVALHVLLQAD